MVEPYWQTEANKRTKPDKLNRLIKDADGLAVEAKSAKQFCFYWLGKRWMIEDDHWLSYLKWK